MNGNGRRMTQRTAPTNPPSGQRRWVASLVCLAASTVVLAGCGGWRQTFGLDHAPPDEFSVVARPPLSMPPDFNLRPPRPGAARPQEVATTQTAANTVFGPGLHATSGAAAGTADSALLSHAGAANAQPDIRAAIDAETRNLITADKRWVDRLIFWQKQEQPYTAVDAAGESKRLHDNAALGQPVTAGDTPTIERKRKAPLEGIF